MPTPPNLRFLGGIMVVLGLAATIALPILARQVTFMTESLGLVMRAQFLGAAAITLGGAWLEWFAHKARPPGAFPVLQDP